MREVFAYNELTLKLLGDRKHLSEMGNGDKHYKKKKNGRQRIELGVLNMKNYNFKENGLQSFSRQHAISTKI